MSFMRNQKRSAFWDSDEVKAFIEEGDNDIVKCDNCGCWSDEIFQNGKLTGVLGIKNTSGPEMNLKQIDQKWIDRHKFKLSCLHLSLGCNILD